MKFVISRRAEAIKRTLQPFENLDDLNVMLEELVDVREELTSREQSEADEELLLSLLCVITYPGKPPEYSHYATAFRQSNMGIRFDAGKREQFRRIVYDAVRAAGEGPVDFTNVQDVLGRAVMMSANEVRDHLF
jgi:hypothetical protein